MQSGQHHIHNYKEQAAIGLAAARCNNPGPNFVQKTKFRAREFFIQGSEGLETAWSRPICTILTTSKLVEADGIEPTTSGLQSRRSPN
jgi:hypothetical protein